MKALTRVPVQPLAILCALCAGCATFSPSGRTPAAAGSPAYLGAGSTVKPSGFQQMLLQTYKELADITAKHDEEQSRRVKAEKDIELLQKEQTRQEAKAAATAAALEASQKRIQELETKLGTLHAETEQVKGELATAQKDLVAARAMLEKETERANKLDTKLLAEVSEHVRTKTQLTRLKIDILKGQVQQQQGTPAPEATP